MGDTLPADNQTGEGRISYPRGPGSVSVHLQLDEQSAAEVSNGASAGLGPSGLLRALLRLGRNLFSDKDGNLLKTGDVVKFQKLANTLEIIAKEGAGAFYRGRIAEHLISDVRAAGTNTWSDALTPDDRPNLVILHELEPLSAFRRNADGGGLGGVQSRGDGCVERSPGGVPHVLPPAACRGRHGRLHHERVKR